MMTGAGFVYLASRSARRRELLAQIGVPYQVLLLREDLRRGVDVDETRLPDESPRAHVMRVAQEKAVIAWRQIPARDLTRAPVLGADTSVVLDAETLGKPSSADDASSMLERLSGRSHHVLTGVALVQDEHVETAFSSSEVEFRELSEAEIRRYVESGEPFGKAGAYAIQGKAAVFARRIEGSYSGIMGLPLFETAELLRNFGIDAISSVRARSHF